MGRAPRCSCSNGEIRDFNISARVAGHGLVSTQFFLPPAPNQIYSACLAGNIEQMCQTRSALSGAAHLAGDRPIGGVPEFEAPAESAVGDAAVGGKLPAAGRIAIRSHLRAKSPRLNSAEAAPPSEASRIDPWHPASTLALR
jgi:hypothetical protein